MCVFSDISDASGRFIVVVGLVGTVVEVQNVVNAH